MSILRPAAEIEPCLEISSMRAILPGPRWPKAPKLMRIVKPASATPRPLPRACPAVGCRRGLGACRMLRPMRGCLPLRLVARHHATKRDHCSSVVGVGIDDHDADLPDRGEALPRAKWCAACVIGGWAEPCETNPPYSGRAAGWRCRGRHEPCAIETRPLLRNVSCRGRAKRNCPWVACHNIAAILAAGGRSLAPSVLAEHHPRRHR
jgi:hypothetical protein